MSASMPKYPFKKRLQLTNVGHVVGGTKDQFWSSVVSRADIADIWFAGDQDLGRTEITQLEDTRCRVEKEILGFDISVTDTDRVDVGE